MGGGLDRRIPGAANWRGNLVAAVPVVGAGLVVARTRFVLCVPDGADHAVSSRGVRGRGLWRIGFRGRRPGPGLRRRIGWRNSRLCRFGHGSCRLFEAGRSSGVRLLSLWRNVGGSLGCRAFSRNCHCIGRCQCGFRCCGRYVANT